MAKVSNNFPENTKKKDDIKKSEEKKRNNKDLETGSKTFFKGIVIGGGLYSLIICLLFFFLNLHYLSIAIMAFVIALLLLLAFKISTGLEAARMKAPILVAMFVIFILFISYYYSKGIDLDKNKPKISNNISSFRSETLTFIGKERRIAKITFPKGKEYRLTVYGAPVDFVKKNDTERLTQEDGTCIYEVRGGGKALKFNGTGSQSSVIIEWSE